MCFWHVIWQKKNIYLIASFPPIPLYEYLIKCKYTSFIIVEKMFHTSVCLLSALHQVPKSNLFTKKISIFNIYFQVLNAHDCSLQFHRRTVSVLRPDLCFASQYYRWETKLEQVPPMSRRGRHHRIKLQHSDCLLNLCLRPLLDQLYLVCMVPA